MSNDLTNANVGVEGGEGVGAAIKDGHGKDKPNHVSITVVVNTDDTVVEAKEHWTLHEVAEKALKQTGTTSRDLSQWRLKDSKGTPLEFGRTVESYGIKTGTTLFLSLEAGHNG